MATRIGADQRSTARPLTVVDFVALLDSSETGPISYHVKLLGLQSAYGKLDGKRMRCNLQ